VLERLQEKIRNLQYIVTVHCDDKMDIEELTIEDIENSILTGKIIEPQRDIKTKELKYRIRGETSSGEAMEAVVKISIGGVLVFITVFRL